MTDDTLREECLEFACNQGWLDYHEETNELLDEHGIVDALLAFARSQQAKGLREAAGLLDPRRLHYVATRQIDTLVRGIQLNEVNGCIETITAQATAREGKS